MTLPITESILRGELRPNILQQSLEPKALEMLIRNARKISQKTGLVELELAINSVLKELVNTKDIYAEDRKTRDAAMHARASKIMTSNKCFKYITSEVIVTDVLPLTNLCTPLLRFYNTILDAEVFRTRMAMLHLHRAVQDDAFVRSTLKALFRKIKNVCRESLLWEEHQDVMSLLPIKLTHLYFTLLNTYREVLESHDAQEYEDDFMDFVYGWKGEYPSNEEETAYNKQCAIKTQIGNTINYDFGDNPSQESKGAPKSQRAKDKADLFLEAVAEYNFLEMPMIKQLDKAKVHDLVMTMLENPGHACAMLEHLKFYEWIKTNQKVGFNVEQYEKLCSKVIMNKDSHYAFHNVRKSLKPDNQNADKYKAYAYIDQVANEYDTLLNK